MDPGMRWGWLNTQSNKDEVLENNQVTKQTTKFVVSSILVQPIEVSRPIGLKAKGSLGAGCDINKNYPLWVCVVKLNYVLLRESLARFVR